MQFGEPQDFSRDRRLAKVDLDRRVWRIARTSVINNMTPEERESFFQVTTEAEDFNSLPPNIQDIVKKGEKEKEQEIAGINPAVIKRD